MSGLRSIVAILASVGALAGAARAEPPELPRAEIDKRCIEAATKELKRMFDATPTAARAKSSDAGKRTERIVELELIEAGQKATYLFTCGLDPENNRAYAASVGKKKPKE